ncbi:DNA-directed DNA polymerase protein [Dioscorea alata]|uniref:DNA-directed DNA polymerase protein n=1 Tax=Dioscorea alata TaxID=55571 RepID=A0ACB7VQR5_DIOAL|nr:DNA-directed DNA polymerase protein [Dioscorea alata]
MATAPPENPSSDVFSLRIVSIDYYMAAPIPDLDFSYSDFQGREVEEVPVIRIYGSTPAGQKGCMHVHGALPYLYIPCPELVIQNAEEGRVFIHALSLAIEKALRVKNNSTSKQQHVHGCSIVRGKRIYGYYFSDELFVKIYLYYPYEVARLATLLLSGAILNRSFQPFESHIPYLLQFLVDYNLHGMSHIHTSKVKFRSPLPDKFLLKRDINEDSSSDAVVSPAIWLSSSVRADLIWPVVPTGHNQLEDKIIHLVKRHSACGLELDSSVEDILNQNHKMYASLSQNLSDVKMVQSLIPLWEEEYKRTGTQEAVKSLDSTKPLPRDTLELFRRGLEYDKAFSEMLSEHHPYITHKEITPEMKMKFAEYIKTFSDIDRAIRFVQHTWASCSGEPLRQPRGDERNVGLSCSEGVEDATLYVTKHESQELESTSQKISSFAIKDEDSMAIDTEALGLLTWLASSQAIEELNTDDELVHEAILSPILSTKSFKQALEIAHLDYENASQQECLDILDSVYDDEKSVGLREQTSWPTCFDEKAPDSLGNVIPQLDGSPDDHLLTTDKCKRPERPDLLSIEKEKDPHNQELKCASATVDCKSKRSKHLWGNLPLSKKLNECEISQTASANSSPGDEMMKDCQLGSSFGSRVALGFKDSKVDREASDDKVGKTMATCSVRDLTRTKRFSRPEHLEPEINLATALPDMQKNEMMAGCTVGSVFASEEGHHYIMPDETRHAAQYGDEGLQEIAIDALSHLGTDHTENRLLHDAKKQSENHNDEIGQGVSDGPHFCNPTDSNFALDTNAPQTKKQLDASINYNIFRNVQDVEYYEVDTEMGFIRKPPSVDHMVIISEDPLSSTTGAGVIMGGQKQDLEDIPPFFINNFADRSQRNHTSNQDSTLGVSVHFQNDGAALYLLTHATSPPTLDSVKRWISKVAKHDEFNQSAGVLSSDIPPVPNDTHPLKHERLKSSQENSNLEGLECSSDVNNISSGQQSLGVLAKEDVLSCSEHDISQISGPDEKSNLTPLSQIGFCDPASMGDGQQLTIMSIEIHTESRGDLQPDPQFDAVNVVALVVQEDTSHTFDVHVLIHGNNEEPCARCLDGVSDYHLLFFSEEKLLLINLSNIISSCDPDILMGWEIQSNSLGYLAERAANLGISLLKNMSRTPSHESDLRSRHSVKTEGGNPDVSPPDTLAADAIIQDTIIDDEWGRTHASGIHVGGRIVLNIWRLMRSEVKLNIYTAEAVAEEVLRQKVPSIPCRILYKWFLSGPGRARYRCIEYVAGRAKLNIQIMNQLDMVALQPAMECLPLVMEPESGFFADPVVVLDFQSLYPSMIIGYNLCFSTCLGKVTPSRETVLGVSCYAPDQKIFMDLKQEILITPNGVMYVPDKVRKGVLPRLLEEILSTRIMVKKAMKKLSTSQQVLQRIFNSRQLALKLIANVTYGYTAAGFSGRMPCAELADSIVQCGRMTLETAISFVNNHDKWKARVVYGDTDSMFVLLKGRSVEEAFKIGNEIALAITAMNPDPVTLKMEKVYYPCFLLTKKRYVGYSFESPDQKNPKFDAKGIETVRRDTCPAVAKTLEKSLRIFFEHKNIYEVKSYLERQWTRILAGRVSLQDFVFAKEVRLGTYSTRAASLPPAAIVATKAMRIDPRAVPHYGERIPYIVIHGEPGARLIDMVVHPSEVLDINSPYRLNDLYYITKQIIPALQRVFGLVNADLNQWFSGMPRPVRPTLSKSYSSASHSGSWGGCEDNEFGPENSKKAMAKRSRIDTYYISKHCTICGELVQASAYFCPDCLKNSSLIVSTVVGRTSKLEREIRHLADICNHCGGGDWIVESGVKCTSLACAVYYERRKVQKEFQSISSFATAAGLYPCCFAELF